MKLLELVERNRKGEHIGLPCFCSSNEFVIHAAFDYASTNDLPLIIEATCNQVNPFGGYTGQTPDQFADKIRAFCKDYKYDASKLILGGDHLGPEPWKDQPAKIALENAALMVKQYVEAGFTKIHLDASMACADDAQLSTEEIAKRAATLCEVAERFAPHPERLGYIIGTEVPIPGGETAGMDGIAPSDAGELAHTIEAHREAFAALGLNDAFARVVAVVVQPGVDFGSDDVMVYARQSADALSAALLKFNGPSFEAHSTDYQPTGALSQLVADHFAFLKVGPELTFCLREAVYSLAEIETQLAPATPSNIMDVLERVMLENPKSWQKYYHGNEAEQAYQRVFSFSDRIRYYWDYPEVQAALKVLLANLSGDISAPLMSQYLGKQIGEFEIANGAELIGQKISASVARYYQACGF